MKRRGNNEGSIYQRGDGRWAATVSVNGRRITRYGRTRQEVSRRLRELQRDQDQGLPVVTARMLLKDYLAQWLENIQHRVRLKTFEGYESLIRVHVTPRLGHIKLGKLTPEQINKAWSDMLVLGKSASVIGHCHLRLSKALTDAVKRQLIYRNPCQNVSPPRVYKKEMRPPSSEAVHALLEAARDTEYYEALHTAFYTGARRGELLGLRWGDIDLVMGTASVSRTVHRAKGGQSVFTEPKTPKGKRLVSLTPSSSLVLRALRERQEADGMLLGYQVTEDSPVFRYRSGSPILPRAFSGAFRKIMRRAGLEGYRLHDTRHAHATLMLRQGVHPKIVQERLGHSRISVTLDTYSHVTAGLQAAAALRFEESLAPVRTPEPDPHLVSM
jgi:integrase